MKKALTDTFLRALKRPSSGRLEYADAGCQGLEFRITEAGARSWSFRYRVPETGKLTRATIGAYPDIGLGAAREKANDYRKVVARGEDPLKQESKPVNEVLDAFEKDHVEGLRSAETIKQALKNHVRPRIGEQSIYLLKRSNISSMLNEIKDDSGPVMADRVLAYVRKAFNWYMGQDDEFISPIVRGMAKTKPKERARKRVLTDDEIRDVWAALDDFEEPACYPPFVKSLLLAMTRRTESARMHTRELEDGLWTIPAERYKNKLDHVIPLTSTLVELIGKKPSECKSNSWFVFSTTSGAKPFSGFSKAKKELDRIIAAKRKAENREPMKQWQLHDLRRTGRSLMSRAKVDADHAERCMGHVIGGVRETYDRYEYLDEKRAAFEALAGLVQTILRARS